MTPGFAKSRKELFWLPYPEQDKVIINAHNFTLATWSPAVNGKTPISAWVPSRDTVGNGTTTLTDLSTGGNNGTLTNMDAASDWVSDTDAGGVRALDFDGSNDFVTLGTGLDQNGALSISAWIKTTTVAAGTREIIANCNSDGTAQDYCFELNRTAGKLTVLYGDGVVITSTSSLSSNTWYHVGFTRTASGTRTLKIYINGALDATATNGRTPSATNARTSIGRLGDVGLFYFSGRIDDVRLFSEVLTDSDFTALYASGAGRGVSA